MNRKVVYMALAIGSIGLFAAQALAGAVVTGASRTSDVLLDSSDDWTVILSVRVDIPETDDEIHGCVVNASADVQSSGPERVENHYRFTVTRNLLNPTTNGGNERTLEFYNHDDFNDLNSQPVATTRTFTALTRSNGVGLTQNQHTFRFLGRKVQEADSNTNVLDASMSIICVHTN